MCGGTIDCSCMPGDICSNKLCIPVDANVGPNDLIEASGKFNGSGFDFSLKCKRNAGDVNVTLFVGSDLIDSVTGKVCLASGNSFSFPEVSGPTGLFILGGKDLPAGTMVQAVVSIPAPCNICSMSTFVPITETKSTASAIPDFNYFLIAPLFFVMVFVLTRKRKP